MNTQFRRILAELHAFPDTKLLVDDYEEAARMCNSCRQQGIAGSPIDFLLCSVAFRNQWSIFTTDRNFDRYCRVLDVKLFVA